MVKQNYIFEKLRDLEEQRKYLNREINSYNELIDKYSCYNFYEMTNTISKLISFLEDEEYITDEEYILEDYIYSPLFISNSIFPKNKNKNRYSIHISINTEIISLDTKTQTAFFIPTKSRSIFQVYSIFSEVVNLINDFLSDFFHHLFNEKTEDENISLCVALEKYITSMENFKATYKKRKNLLIRIDQKHLERKSFKNSCMVDMESTFAAMCYISKKYDKINSEILIIEDEEEKRKIKRLVINQNTFDKIIAVGKVSPDPEDDFLYFEEIEDNNKVNFFKLKELLDEKSHYLKYFLEALEKRFINEVFFLDSKIIEAELINVSNKYKKK